MAKFNNERPIVFGEYIANTGATIRKTAAVFNVSKSTVHVDVSHKLKHIDFNLYIKVEAVLKRNFNERSFRGGMATKIKYLLKKEHSVWVFLFF